MDPDTLARLLNAPLGQLRLHRDRLAAHFAGTCEPEDAPYIEHICAQDLRATGVANWLRRECEAARPAELPAVEWFVQCAVHITAREKAAALSLRYTGALLP